MKKPWWIRAFAWLGWVGVLWILLLFEVMRQHDSKAVLGAWMLLEPSVMGTLACFGLWIFLSVLCWAIDRHACAIGLAVRGALDWSGRQPESHLNRSAQRSAEAFERHTLVGQETPRRPPEPLEVDTFGRECQSCHKESASVRCSVHGVALCPACLPKHDTRGSCSYTVAHCEAAGEAEKKRSVWRVMTSPLDGARG